MIAHPAPEAGLGFAPAETADDVHRRVREGLERAATVLESHDLPVPELRGKLLRPTIAYTLVPPDRRHELDDRFWLGALAIQMVHEASLLHDDIVDEADERRGEPTASSERGVRAALVLGDHYLTASYRAALWTRSPAFFERFVTSVERTVAGEILQGRAVGRHLDLATYFDVILGKSGELFRAAAALGPCVLGLDRVDDRATLGLQLGALYQQVDDLLDYCPAADTGKEALRDYRQRKWTWVLDLADVEEWSASEEEILETVFAPGAQGVSPAHRAVVYLEVRRAAIARRLAEWVPGEHLVTAIMDEWISAARAGVEAQIEALGDGAVAGAEPAGPALGPGRSPEPSAEAWVVRAATRLGDPHAWRRYFRVHARTFSFASRLFPPAERHSVEALYAYCRFTDDLVDGAPEGTDAGVVSRRLEVWRELSRDAFERGASDIPLLGKVMADAARARVDWLYPQALLEGVAMDLEPRRYADWNELGRYTFCVAGAVGGWMTHLFGIRDGDTLTRAHALGHAMQLTNIARDVGEDLLRGRIYLPETLLAEHGLDEETLGEWHRSSEPLPESYRDAMRQLIAVADARYEAALPGMSRLPPFFSRPVAVAAAAYRGIHDEIRRNDFDTLRRRAHTSLPRKAWLGAVGLVRARRAPARVGATEEGLAT